MSQPDGTWTRQMIAGRKALVLVEDDAETLRQRAHDLRGAARTLDLACELGAFRALGDDKAVALLKAIKMLTGEARILIEAYSQEW